MLRIEPRRVARETRWPEVFRASAGLGITLSPLSLPHMYQRLLYAIRHEHYAGYGRVAGCYDRRRYWHKFLWPLWVTDPGALLCAASPMLDAVSVAADVVTRMAAVVQGERVLLIQDHKTGSADPLSAALLCLAAQAVFESLGPMLRGSAAPDVVR